MEISTPKHAGLGTIEANLKEIALAAMQFFSKIVPMAAALLADTQLLAKHQAAVRQRKGGPHHLVEHVAKYIQAEQRLGRIRAELDPLDLLCSCLLHASIGFLSGKHPVRTFCEWRMTNS
jgi:hypothetical protein